MLKVNAKKLKNDIDKFSVIINELEDSQINLFENLKNSCIDWQDGNSIEFDEHIYLDKKETLTLRQYIYEKKDIYNKIFTEYSSIGNKVSCNLNSKNKILYELDVCINKSTSIINKLNNLNQRFDFPEQNEIYRELNKVQKIKNILLEHKNKIKKMYEKIEKIEKDIYNKISSLEDVKITDFNFIFNRRNHSVSKGTINTALLEKDIEKTNLYINEENQSLNDIYTSSEDCNSNYNSKNSELLSRSNYNFEQSINQLLNKREKYIETLNKVIENYNLLTDMTIREFNGEI